MLAAGTLKVGDLQDAPPSRIGRYSIGGIVGHGATGQVYRAHDPKIGRDVAIKLLDPNVSRSTSLQRFGREVKALARLRHPNIVEIYDSGTFEGRPYFVMELVEGRSLDEVMLSLPSRIAALRLVAMACNTAHRFSVVHRDLKPSNILVGERLVVVDFGLARLLDDPQKVTSRGTVLGTPAYMSPEQARGEEVDLRADIYSLGVMLYEATTGQRPFAKTTPWAVIELVANVEPPRPRELAPDLSDELEQIILAAMAKDRDKRTESCAQLATQLGEWLENNGLPLQLTPEVPTYPLEPPVSSSSGSLPDATETRIPARQTVSARDGRESAATASWSLLLSDALCSRSTPVTADSTVALQPNQQTALDEVVTHLESIVSGGSIDHCQREAALLSAARARLVMAGRDGGKRARCVEQATANVVAALRMDPESEASSRAVCAVCRWVFSRGAAGMSDIGGTQNAHQLAADLFGILDASAKTSAAGSLSRLVMAHAQLLKAAALLSDSFSNTQHHQLLATSKSLANAIETLQSAEVAAAHHSDILLAQCAGYLLTVELQQCLGRKGSKALSKAEATLARLQETEPGHPELGLWCSRYAAACRQQEPKSS